MASSTLKCPTCGGSFDPTLSAAVPFCSQYCREVDLGRWLDERQTLPVFKNPDELPPEEDLPADDWPDDDISVGESDD